MKRRFMLGREQAPERVDRVLTRLLSDVSRSSVQRWIVEGRVLVDGRPTRVSAEVAGGSIIEVDPGPPPASSVIADASVSFRVEYEDADLIVVDKPAGVVVHPGRGRHAGTLVAGLLARPGFERAPTDPLDPNGLLRPGVVHRIDKDTSGLLVVAKNAKAREGLKAQLAAHSVERLYRAITLGVPNSQTIETLHARHPRARLKFTSRIDQGRRAVTHIALDEVLALSKAALVSCSLETGRTHQIRVHLAEQARTPILADAIYGYRPADAKLQEISRQLGRQALHAQILGFSHPISGAALRFYSPLPPDMAAALELLRQID